MKHLTQTQLSGLKSRLLEEQERLQTRLKENGHYGLGESMRDNTGELTEIDNHPGDAATDLYHRSMDISLLEHDEHELEDIEAALDAMERGKYGICAVGGEPIPYERLAALPAARFCTEHSPRQDQTFRRPAEEAVLAHPFGRTSMDEHDESAFFDGEDAWQIVESWGSSNSPAMAEDNEIGSYNEMEIEADENEGYVEPWENFIATDMSGNHVTVVQGHQYQRYLKGEEGWRVKPDAP